MAAAQTGSVDSRQALETLCTTYWYPLYAYVRRQGYLPDDAQDMVQEFFGRLLEKNYLLDADQHRGKFRTFLLAALSHFMANERRRAGARKRGGGRTVLSLDFESGELRYVQELSHELTAQRIFDRSWALALLEQTFARVRAEYARSPKLELFERLKQYLGGDEGAAAYRTIAGELGTTEGAVKVAVHRLRRRYRELLRDEIAQTVTTPDEVDEELRDLFEAVAVQV